MKSQPSEEIKNSFIELLNIESEDERLELEAQALAFSFLAEIDKAMEQQNISKKVLASSIGTSASYISQLFRGDRLPNFTNLAKMKEALNLEFDIQVKDNNTLEEKTFDFPNIEPVTWGIYKTFKPNYTDQKSYYGNVEYDETAA